MPDRAVELRLITFTVGFETFVLDIMGLRQIIPYTGSTTVPTAPPFIEGIIVLRNEVIPIVDLRARLYPQLEERSEQPLVLITYSNAGIIGIKVDAVRRIVNVSTDALLPPPPIIRGIRGELLIAIVPYEDEVYLLIDIENILSGDEKQVLAAADLTPQDVEAPA
ncbi:MAG: purine-binding chemotaxis protein CheW [Acidobacteria bacterium]|nr:purine-binding chemotaxis protein CheW [Acidobacteriota bacterium]MBV9068954.1 purine-binding chemotaxis protein CheW [Acidobacteriota bacterium]MBV9185296.1 purine-binding chemotaxis protein CheW [Acidobacteriota bacterium]